MKRLVVFDLDGTLAESKAPLDVEMAMLHRPLSLGARPEEIARHAEARVVDLDHESIWISYCPMGLKGLEPNHIGLFNSHHRIATPVSPWERLKIGGDPLLTPELPRERHGTIANVVFPTGIDRRDDFGLPDRFGIYYGMANNRIGAARLDVPDSLPTGRVADPPEAKV